MELLGRAVAAIRAGRMSDTELAFRPAIEINLRVPALIPDDYLPDVHNRLIMYKRLASAACDAELDGLQSEMIDRFGSLPPGTRNLLRIARMRVRCQGLGVARIEASATGGVVEFTADTAVAPLTIVDLVQHDPRRYRLDGGTRLRFVEALEEVSTRIAFVEDLMDRLSRPGTGTPTRTRKT